MSMVAMMNHYRLFFLMAAFAAISAAAQDPVALDSDTRFLQKALSFARVEAEKAGGQCREPQIHRNSPPWRDAWAGLSVVLDLSWSGKIDGGKASATLSIGLAGTNDFNLAWFDPELAFQSDGWTPARHTPNGETVYTNANVAGIERYRHEMDDSRRDRILHTTIGDRFLVLKIPASLDPPGLWDGFWKSAVHAFAQPDWAPEASGDPAPGDEEAWGLESWPAFVERARMAGLVGIGFCWFDSRERFHNGRSARIGNFRIDNVDAPGWRLFLSARTKDTDGKPSIVSAKLCVCKDNGQPFHPNDLQKDSGNAPDILRHRTAGGRLFLLCPDGPFHDDPVWNDIFVAIPCDGMVDSRAKDSRP